MRLRSLLAGATAASAAVTILLVWLVAPAAIDDIIVAGAAALIAAAAIGSLVARHVARELGALRERVSAFQTDGERGGVAPRLEEVRLLALALERAARVVDQHSGRAARERDELAVLTDAAGEGLVQIAGDGRIIRFNPAARALLGLPETARGQSHEGAVRSGPVRDLIRRALDGDDVIAEEIALDDRRVLAHVRPLDPERPPDRSLSAGVIVVLVDLTHIRKLETVRRDFVANVSHELKTPLTSIRGYAETLLSDDLPDEMRRKFLTTIEANAHRLQRIVDDLLDLSSVESGGWRPDLRIVDLEAAALEAWQEFEERAERRGVRFDVVVEGAGRTAHADPLALRQVLTNLYDNALRHASPEARVKVRITSATATAPPCGGSGVAAGETVAPPTGPNGADRAGWRVVEVIDTGAGIPREALPRIFERFYRVDPARSRVEGGTGLGLAIVKHMIESLGGCVVARSELGKGTTIRFALPAA